MADTAASDVTLIDEETRLARAAADGDGEAFATLYERYEKRAYNLAFRVTGSEDDAADALQDAFLSVMQRLPKLTDPELAFGSYLFTATRNACYDLMEKRRRSEPSDSIPESAAPVGTGAGGLGLDPGDPEEDPDRKQLVSAQQEEIKQANARLPARQREALALRELEELSYDEIAAIMEMNRNSVAQLISRARINLRDELRGTTLASIAASSPDCERALPLLAMRDDGQLDECSDDADWLDAHLAACDTCGLALESMQEAGASYRAWAPVGVAPWLFEEAMARAAESLGYDWSEEIARHSAARGGRSAGAGRRWALLAAGLATILIAIGLAARSTDDAAVPVEETSAPLRDGGAAGVSSLGAARPVGKPVKSPSPDTEKSSVEDPADPAPAGAATDSTATSTKPTPRSQSTRRSRAGGRTRSGVGGTKGTGAPVASPEPAPQPEPEPDPAPEPPDDPPEREDPPPREDPPDSDPPRRSPVLPGPFTGPRTPR